MLWFLNSRLKLLVQLFWEFEIFYCLSSADCRSMTSQHVWCILDLFTQTDGLAVQSQGPALFFSVESSSPRPPPTLDLIFSWPMFSVPQPPSSCLVWEWQGSQVKLTPVSLSSLKQAQALAQLSQSLFVRLSVKPGCYSSSHLGVESPSVMEHFDDTGITSLTKKKLPQLSSAPLAHLFTRIHGSRTWLIINTLSKEKSQEILCQMARVKYYNLSFCYSFVFHIHISSRPINQFADLLGQFSEFWHNWHAIMRPSKKKKKKSLQICVCSRWC